MIDSGTMSRINEIFLELNKIIYVSTTSFSVEYLEKSPSYFRTIRYGNNDVPIAVYICLLENLDKKLHEFKVREQCRLSKALATKIHVLIEDIRKELIEDFLSNLTYPKRALGILSVSIETSGGSEIIVEHDTAYNVPPIIL